MSVVLKTVGIYLALLVIFRLSGQRSLAQITTFDFILLLIVGEATQQALTGPDYSMTTALLIIITLVGADILMSRLKQRWKTLERISEGLPLILVENGNLVREHMDKARVDESDIMAAARQLHGLERLDQIKYAVMERSGGVTVVPK